MRVNKPELRLKDFSKISSLKALNKFEVLHQCLRFEIPIYTFTSSYLVDHDADFFSATELMPDSTSLTFPVDEKAWHYFLPDLFELTTEAIEGIVHAELDEFGAYDYDPDCPDTYNVYYSPHTYLIKYKHLVGVPAANNPWRNKESFVPKPYKTEDLYIRSRDIEQVANIQGPVKANRSNPSGYSERLPDINLKRLHCAIIDNLIKALKEDASNGKIDHSFKLKDFLNDSNTFNSKALARSVHEDSIKYFQNADQYKVNTIAEKINDILKKFEK